MISIEIIVAVLILHYIGDFVLQNELIAINKSSDNLTLLAHVTIYIIALTPLSIFLTPINAAAFLASNYMLHYITDYCTSRVTKFLFKTERYYTDIPNLGAFSIIGFDQLLHMLSLFLTLTVLL